MLRKQIEERAVLGVDSDDDESFPNGPAADETPFRTARESDPTTHRSSPTPQVTDPESKSANKQTPTTSINFDTAYRSPLPNISLNRPQQSSATGRSVFQRLSGLGAWLKEAITPRRARTTQAETSQLDLTFVANNPGKEGGKTFATQYSNSGAYRQHDSTYKPTPMETRNPRGSRLLDSTRPASADLFASRDPRPSSYSRYMT